MQELIESAYADPSGGPSIEKKEGTLLRFLANFVSWVFHPMFIVTYTLYFLIFIHPYAFAGVNHSGKVFKLITVFLSTAFFPAFSVFLMWRLKLFLQSLYLRTARERIVPYMIAMIFYWWVWHVFANIADNPPVAVHFLLGSFLAVCGVWFCNIYFKISMHATAMGGVVMMLLLFSFVDNYASGLYLSIAFLATGMVCTARFIVSDHTPFEIYSGLLVGALAQLIAWQF
jgi:hypothetical protein